MDEYVELDGWVDWDLSSPEAFVVCVNGRGTGLAYPFSLDDLYEVLDELDEDVVAAAV